MSDVERSVVVSKRELGVIAGLADQHDTIQIAIREQRIDSQDAYSAFREGRVRSYVVTLYSPGSDEYIAPGPTPLQFLLVSGPAIEGSIDVVLLTNRAKDAAA